MDDLHFVWLEITGKCQLACTHCYADSGPHGDDGIMREQDWAHVINQSAALGTRTVQFIGGEPTMHPALPSLVRHALECGVRVEVFTNLVHITDHLWDAFDQPGVSLATSYYSDSSAEHSAITGRRGSRDRTRANIIEALRRSIPLRVGLIELSDDQGVEQAERELRALGVVDIGKDRLRGVGRGARNQVPDIHQLCGDCARGKVAISPTGEVWPCVFSRWIPVGNVRERTLAEIITGPAMLRAEDQLTAAVPANARCNPRCCPSTMCDPQCSPSCSPSCRPAGNCSPSGNCAPAY